MTAADLPERTRCKIPRFDRMMFYRVVGDGHVQDFQSYEDAEQQGLRVSKGGAAYLGEYHHEGAHYARMNIVKFRNGKYYEPPKRMRLNRAT